jgi:DNA-binding transcriptional LysR family regulator
MTVHVVEADLTSGELVEISVEDAPPGMQGVTMSAVYRTDSPPRPGGRWFIDHLKQDDARRPKELASRSLAMIAEARDRASASSSIPHH